VRSALDEISGEARERRTAAGAGAMGSLVRAPLLLEKNEVRCG
jgi:hypothetical protein